MLTNFASFPPQTQFFHFIHTAFPPSVLLTFDMRPAVLLSLFAAASVSSLPVAEPVPGHVNAGNVDWRRGNVDWRRGNGRGNVDWRRGDGNNNWQREVDERGNRDSRQSEAEARGNVDWRRFDTNTYVEAKGYQVDVRGNVDWRRTKNEAVGNVD